MSKISVIIPCYNLGEYLHEAIDSVLAQTFQDFEIIVVNDGSTDDLTIKIIESLDNPKIKVLSTSNQGLPAARNNGIKVSSGEYICCLDADDKLCPEFLQKTIDVLEHDPICELGFVTTWVQTFEGDIFLWKTEGYNPLKLLLENVVHVASLFRKECWEKVGGYATNMSGYQDWNFWVSIMGKGYKWAVIEEPLFLYRKRIDSMITKSDKKRPELIQQLILNNISVFQENIDSVIFEKEKYIIHLHQIIRDQNELIKCQDKQIQLLNDQIEKCLINRIKRFYKRIFYKGVNKY